MKPAGTEHEVVQIGQVARHEKAPRNAGALSKFPLGIRQDGPPSASGFVGLVRKRRTCPSPCIRASVEVHPDIPRTCRRPHTRLWNPRRRAMP
jgi:hypothetical protein